MKLQPLTPPPLITELLWNRKLFRSGLCQLSPASLGARTPKFCGNFLHCGDSVQKPFRVMYGSRDGPSPSERPGHGPLFITNYTISLKGYQFPDYYMQYSFSSSSFVRGVRLSVDLHSRNNMESLQMRFAKSWRTAFLHLYFAFEKQIKVFSRMK